MALPARPLADRPARRLNVHRADAASGPAVRIEPRRATSPIPERKGRGAERPSPPPLRIVPPATRRRRAAFAAGLVAASLLGVMLGPIALQAKLAADQLRLDRVERERRVAAEHQEKLQLQLTLLESPAHVVDVARQMGMLQPAEVAYVAPSAEAVAAVMQSTGAAPGGPVVTASADGSSG